MSDGLKPLSAGLGPQIEALEQRAQAAFELTDRVRASLPAPDKDHVISASYRGDTLVVTVDSAAWCPRLRFLQQVLIDKLHAAGETQFTKVKVRVGART